MGTRDGKLTSVSAYEENLRDLFPQLPRYTYERYKHNLKDLAEYRRKSSRELLNEIRESPYGFGRDKPAVVLASRGRKAEDILLQDLAQAEGYYLACLVNILGEIPSAERNSAFMSKLTQLVVDDHAFSRLKAAAEDDVWRYLFRPSYIVPMIWALAVSGESESIPIIRKYVRDESDVRIRARARVALNVLGKPELIQESGFSVVLEEGISYQRDPADDHCFDILRDLLRHGLLTSSFMSPDKQTFLVKEVKRVHRVTTLSGILPEELGDWSELSAGQENLGEAERPGYWELSVRRGKQGKVPVDYFWLTGPLTGGSYVGVVHKPEKTWLCIFWQPVMAI